MIIPCRLKCHDSRRARLWLVLKHNLPNQFSYSLYFPCNCMWVLSDNQLNDYIYLKIVSHLGIWNSCSLLYYLTIYDILNILNVT